MKRITLLLIAIISLFCFTSCNNEKEPTEADRFNELMTEINTNLMDSTAISYSWTIHDGDVLVSDSSKTITISDQGNGTFNLTVITVDQVLGTNFDLENRQYTDYITGAKPETLFNYNFTYDLFSELNVTDNSITGTIAQANVSTVLNTTVNNSSDLEVVINYSENRITSYEFSYTSTNSNSVVITATYTY